MAAHLPWHKDTSSHSLLRGRRKCALQLHLPLIGKCWQQQAAIGGVEVVICCLNDLPFLEVKAQLPALQRVLQSTTSHAVSLWAACACLMQRAGLQETPSANTQWKAACDLASSRGSSSSKDMLRGSLQPGGNLQAVRRQPVQL